MSSISGSNVKRAIVLAAGKGRRLYPLTTNIPKALTPFQDTTILNRQISTLIDVGLEEIIIVIGHKSDLIKSYISKQNYKNIKIYFIDNFEYEKSNNIVSLWLARDYFSKDFLLLESDLIFEKELIFNLCQLNTSQNFAAVSKHKYFMNGTHVSIANDKKIRQFELNISQYAAEKKDLYKTVNIYKITSEYALSQMYRTLRQFIENKETDEYYERVFKSDIRNNFCDMYAFDCSQMKWCEVDTLNDLEFAKHIFLNDRDKKFFVDKLHGSYWRYDYIDFSLLSNPHYPPQKLIDHLSKNTAKIINNYPIDQKNLCRLLSYSLNIPENFIVVGNGASELIKILSSELNGKWAIPTPTFNEYKNANPNNIFVHYSLHEEDGFHIDLNKYAEFLIQNKVDVAVLINPNNPTPTLSSRDSILNLLDKIREAGIRLIVDESFLDFIPQNSDFSLLGDIKKYPNLILINSMGKSHGIGGVRLGYMVTSNEEIINQISTKLPIWNINGFSEEYIRIFSEYNKDFKESCRKTFVEAQSFYKELTNISNLKPYPPMGNFIMCKILDSSITAEDLCLRLMLDYKIIVKDCSDKDDLNSSQFIRIAIKTHDENMFCLKALQRILENIILPKKKA